MFFFDYPSLIILLCDSTQLDTFEENGVCVFVYECLCFCVHVSVCMGVGDEFLDVFVNWLFIISSALMIFCHLI